MSTPERPDEVEREIAHEQAHVDRVHAELAKAGDRAAVVEAEGLARGRTERTGDVRDEELSGLFARDALVFSAHRRRATLEHEHEGLVFGRLDLDHAMAAAEVPSSDGAGTVTTHTASGDPDQQEVRYIGRLGVRDDDYEPLVIDWRAPAASPFYRATPVDPQKVVRRRVLRCRSERVVGVEDDLMVAQAPEGMTVVGDGALMAALTRSRGARMRDIVATIQAHQDEAIRADARGVTEITGGPGTGKTVVALHRAAYLLYSNRRRFEAGGILVVGPSPAYTAYIERVLPSLGEDTVTMRSLGDLVEGMTATRLDPPEAALVKGDVRIREVLSRAMRDAHPQAPERLRFFVAGHAIRIEREQLDQVRRAVMRGTARNQGRQAASEQLAQLAWQQVRQGERVEFLDRWHDSHEVEQFLAAWWRPTDAREVVLWLADRQRLARYASGVLTVEQQEVLHASMQTALETGTWSVADVALVDDLVGRLGPMPEAVDEERGFYEIEELDDLSQYGVTDVRAGVGSSRLVDPVPAQSVRSPRTPQERLMAGEVAPAQDYAHVLVDEAQDLSPMQWRMLGRRGRSASWTVVGDLAQASWPSLDAAAAARAEAFGRHPRQTFHMSTNYRNAREIFDYAERVIREAVPDADIPRAVRETGHEVLETACTADEAAVRASVVEQVTSLLGAVDGSVAVIPPTRWAGACAAAVEDVAAQHPRVVLVDPMSSKGLEYDATLVVDPDEIAAESPGGVRVLYVALTRAAHRMTVMRVTQGDAAP